MSSKCDAFLEAIRKGETEKVRKLISDPEVDPKEGYFGITPFTFACERGNAEIVKLFLECERDVCPNLSDEEGKTALFYAAKYSPHLMRLLMDHKSINVDLCDYHGYSVLYRACHEAYKPIMAAKRFRIDKLEVRIMLEGMRSLRRPDLVEMFEFVLKDPAAAAEQFRHELGHYPARNAGELFATVVLLCDGYLALKE